MSTSVANSLSSSPALRSAEQGEIVLSAAVVCQVLTARTAACGLD
jgi:hypothetical protein